MFLSIKVATKGLSETRRAYLETVLPQFSGSMELVPLGESADVVVVQDGSVLPHVSMEERRHVTFRNEWLEAPALVLEDLKTVFCESLPSAEMCCDPGTLVRPRAWPALLHSASLVCDNPAPLHITGETGVGKDVLARKIHEMSARAQEPFIALNCGAIPPTLVESELMGCEKGAYTDAVARPGALEQAGRGTLFLDEVGELPPEIQVKLLRVLEEKQLKRVGGSRTVKLGFRLITATNRNLHQEVAQGRFRQDLFYRLEVLVIKIPPLRQRTGEIPDLLQQFAGEDLSRQFSQAAMDKLLCHPWPGNIRELRNVVERAVILKGKNSVIGPQHIRFDGLLEFSDTPALEN